MGFSASQNVFWVLYFYDIWKERKNTIKILPQQLLEFFFIDGGFFSL